MQAAFYQQLDQTLSQIKADGFWKAERLIGTPQGPAIHLADGREVLNFCANNYLGLAHDPRLVEAAIDGLHSHGFGMASVRFICGTQDIHRELEGELARFLHTEEAILNRPSGRAGPAGAAGRQVPGRRQRCNRWDRALPLARNDP